MTMSITPEEWERWKNAIHTLYILEDLPLCGPSGVIEKMKLRYDFHARQAPIVPRQKAFHLTIS
jgi:hypothetical protein